MARTGGGGMINESEIEMTLKRIDEFISEAASEKEKEDQRQTELKIGQINAYGICYERSIRSCSYPYGFCE